MDRSNSPLIVNRTGLTTLWEPPNHEPIADHELASLAEVVRRAGSLLLRVDTNSKILRTLGADSPELELCHESFIAQWNERGFRVKTFQEAYGISGLNASLLNEKVVPDTSSLLGDSREHAELIESNHMDMVRFSGANDPGFLKLSGELRLMVLNIHAGHAHTAEISKTLQSTISHSSTNGATTSSHTQIPSQNGSKISQEESECFQKLAFTELNTRQSNIRTEMQGTCEWILHDPMYVQWKHRDDITTNAGLLWIKGKPGAGKSVLMKKVLSVIQKEQCSFGIVLSFFFNARGAKLERTTLGLFRSLVHQLILQDVKVRRVFVKAHKERCQFIGKDWEWQFAELQNFLFESVSRPIERPIHLVIDALDECEEEEVREIAVYLRTLTDTALNIGNVLNIVISSRRYPTITIPRCPEIDIEKGNGGDIEQYVSKKLSAHANDEDPQTLQHTICSKSSNVFLWVVLVVEMIQRAWDSGLRPNEIEALLLRIPGGVEDLFDQLASSLTENERAEACHLFQWVLFRRDPRMRIGSLQYAILFGAREYSSFASLHDVEGALNIDLFRRRVTHYSRGLIEVVADSALEDSKPAAEDGPLFIVQVIHESVRDWFLHGNGFQRLQGSVVTDPIGQGHIAILRCCINILTCSDFLPLQLISQQEFSDKDWKGTRSWSNNHNDIRSRIANLGSKKDVTDITWYAINNVFSHALEAEEAGILPMPLLSQLASKGTVLWATIMTAATNDESIIVHSPLDPPLSLLCAYGFTRSLEYLVTDPQARKVNQITSSSARAAVDRWHTKTLETLAAHCKLQDLRDHQGSSIVHWICRRCLSIFDLGRTLGLLDLAIANGADINAIDNEGKSALSIVVTGRSGFIGFKERSINALIDRGAKIDLMNNRGRTALHEMAAAEGLFPRDDYLQLLLDHGAAPNVKDGRGQTALYIAACRGNLSQVRALVAAHAMVDLADLDGTTPLHAAALFGRYSIIDELLAAKADPNRRDKYGATPLHLVARQQNCSFVKLLVRHGADFSLQDCMGMTPYDIAEANNRPDDILEALSCEAAIG
ncbi:MAG: hypothetical protein Q9165_007511 [Trypethelium subeluteriae]